MKAKKPLKVRDKKRKKQIRGGQEFMKTLFTSDDYRRIVKNAALSAIDGRSKRIE